MVISLAPRKSEGFNSPTLHHTFKGIVMEELKNELKEFGYYRSLILHGETDGRNVLIQKKDGTHAILPFTCKVKRNQIPGMKATLDELERVTIFIDGKEFEFVACQ